MRKIRRATSKVASILVNRDEDSPGGYEIMQGDLLPFVTMRLLTKAERYSIVIFALYLFTCGLHCHSKEMKMKMRTIKKIVNSTAAPRAALSLSTWVDIAVVKSSNDQVEYCGITRAATITYWVASGLVVWQTV